MLKKTIKYVDYDGNPREETHYFNLTEAEVTIWEFSEDGGSLVAFLEKIAEKLDGKEIMRIFKEIITRSYGEKSADGKRFIKSPELTEAFLQTEAYSVLFMELITDDKAAAAFVNGILPAPPKQQNPPPTAQ